MRDRRLGELERRRQVADADLVGRGEPVDDPDARRVGERLEPLRDCLRVGAGKLKNRCFVIF